MDDNRMTRAILILVYSLASSTSWAEVLIYEIYAIDADRGDQLIASGEKTHSLSDISHDEAGVPSHYLALEQGFSVGAVVSRESEVTGFALDVQHVDGGFSWGWFDICSDDIFNKRKGDGRIKVELTGLPSSFEVRKVVFLTDVSLMLNQSEDVERYTHRVDISKGSELVLLP